MIVFVGAVIAYAVGALIANAVDRYLAWKEARKHG